MLLWAGQPHTPGMEFSDCSERVCQEQQASHTAIPGSVGPTSPALLEAVRWEAREELVQAHRCLFPGYTAACPDSRGDLLQPQSGHTPRLHPGIGMNQLCTQGNEEQHFPLPQN